MARVYYIAVDGKLASIVPSEFRTVVIARAIEAKLIKYEVGSKE